jgi:N-methylhydantoinase A/oxoprolinase/acetone carboxylase beta subunit
MNNLILGIDTGGTNTDAVVFNPFNKTVSTYGKAETTHQNLSEGISMALKNLLSQNWP